MAEYFPDDMDPEAVGNALFQQRKRLLIIALASGVLALGIGFALKGKVLDERTMVPLTLEAALLVVAVIIAPRLMESRRIAFVAATKQLIANGKRIQKTGPAFDVVFALVVFGAGLATAVYVL